MIEKTISKMNHFEVIICEPQKVSQIISEAASNLKVEKQFRSPRDQRKLTLQSAEICISEC